MSKTSQRTRPTSSGGLGRPFRIPSKPITVQRGKDADFYEAVKDGLEAIVDILAGNAFDHQLQASMEKAHFQEALAKARRRRTLPNEGVLIIVGFHAWRSDGQRRSPYAMVGPVAKTPEMAIAWWKKTPQLRADYGKGWDYEEIYVWDTVENGVRELLPIEIRKDRCFVPEQMYHHFKDGGM
ncbi:MAG: hypothetical protein AAGF59_15595 [Pseudomonadota bacterium]